MNNALRLRVVNNHVKFTSEAAAAQQSDFDITFDDAPLPLVELAYQGLQVVRHKFFRSGCFLVSLCE